MTCQTKLQKIDCGQPLYPLNKNEFRVKRQIMKGFMYCQLSTVHDDHIQEGQSHIRKIPC